MIRCFSDVLTEIIDMYELIQVTENCYYIQCPSKIGIVRLYGNDVLLVDSGNDKDTAKKIKKITDSMGWNISMIINTHSHADHIGGNRYLQENTGCRIFADSIECGFINNPVLEPSFLFGADPVDELKNKFLLAKESKAEPFSDNFLPEGFEIIPLPGHSFGMVGIKTPDGVIYTADAYSSKETLEKYRIGFVYDVGAYLDTLEGLKNLDAGLFVASHTEVFDNITDILQLNIDAVKEIEEKICELCKAPVNSERLLQMLFDEYELTMNPVQYALVGSTVKSYLAYLKKQGRINMSVNKNMLVWETVQ